jgi:hypothetical protein
VVQPEMLLIYGHAVRDRVRPADPLKLGCDLAVVQVGVVTAVAADDLKRVGVAPSGRPSTMRTGWRLRTTVQPSPG